MATYGQCSGCMERRALKKDGTVRKHTRWLGAGFKPEHCPGVGQPPVAGTAEGGSDHVE